MKKLLFMYLVLILTLSTYLFAIYFRGGSAEAIEQESGLHGSMDEKYVMVNFLTGIDYWKNVLKGFEDASANLGVSIEYKGSTQYDVQEQIIVLEQVIARKPAGIALSAMDSEALNDAINKAVEAGIPVVMFDANAPDSAAYSFIGTNNYEAGVTAARQMANLVGNKGQIGIITHPNQLNHKQRTEGFQDTLRKEYPSLEVIAIEDGKGDQLVTEQKAKMLMNSYEKLVGIFVTEASGGVGVGNALIAEDAYKRVKVIGFDTDKGTLDMIKNGVLSATIAQGTWSMGYWSLIQLFHLHHEILEPIPDWRNTNIAPLPTYVDTGVSVVTKENVDHFYAK